MCNYRELCYLLWGVELDLFPIIVKQEIFFVCFLIKAKGVVNIYVEVNWSWDLISFVRLEIWNKVVSHINLAWSSKKCEHLYDEIREETMPLCQYPCNGTCLCLETSGQPITPLLKIYIFTLRMFRIILHKHKFIKQDSE